MVTSSEARPSTGGLSGRSEDVHKVRLKTSSGVLTVCHRGNSSSDSMDSVKGPEVNERSSDTGDQFSSAKEPSFDTLSDLFDSREKVSIHEDGCSILNFRPDFSSYNFWTSESENMYNDFDDQGVDLSDTFTRCQDSVIFDNDHSQHLVPGMDDSCYADHDIDIFLAKPDRHSQSVYSSGADDRITDRKCYWDFPLELEEDVFQAAANSTILQVTTGVGDRDEKDIQIDEYLVENSPSPSPGPQDCTDFGNIDSSLLVYIPNRFTEEAFVFQSSPAQKTSGNTEAGRTTTARIREQARSRKSSVLQGKAPENYRQSISDRDQDPKSTAYFQDDEEGFETRETPDHLQCVSHRRRRVLRARENSKLTSTSLEDITEVNCEPAAKIRKTESVRRLLNPGYCSDSSEESDWSFHKFSGTETSKQKSVGTPRLHEFNCSGDPMKASMKQVPQSTRSKSNIFRRNQSPGEGFQEYPEVSTMKRTAQDTPKISIGKFKTSTRDGPANSPFKRSGLRKSTKRLRSHANIVTEEASEEQSSHLQSEPKLQFAPEKKLGRRLSKLKRPPLPPQSIEILQEWMKGHRPKPYPSREEKHDLVLRTGLKMTQIENWLANSRQKLKVTKSRSVKYLTESSPEQPTKRSKRMRTSPLKFRI